MRMGRSRRRRRTDEKDEDEEKEDEQGRVQMTDECGGLMTRARKSDMEDDEGEE